MKHYHENEMSTETVIEILKRLKLHNPNHFNIFYGGEPLLRKDLPEIINFCNSEDINYTIITNNSDEIQPMMEKLIIETDYIVGLTSSVDPMVERDEGDGDRLKKCIAAFHRLGEYGSHVKDPVAEITIDNKNVPYLYDLVATLTNMGVNSDITFIDITKNPWYDFSNVTSPSLLVMKTPELEDQIKRIIEDKLDVHMAETLLPKIIQDLPSNMDCNIHEDLHNLTIDADGSIRLCLRIRGLSTPRLQMLSMIHENGMLESKTIREFMVIDKENACRKCNWTCMRMSEILSKKEDDIGSLLHSDRRT